ncbi:MAG: sulfur oxidation c-type cytochrome SoxA [Magnetococcales bacterium]|nr:sulfur oxidation c-type cytochrome SoxA [Magnetococcales bacterium]
MMVWSGTLSAFQPPAYEARLDQGLFKYSPEFRAMADFPPTEGMIEQGLARFRQERGGHTCAECHGESGEKLKGVAAGYPKFDPKLGKPKIIEQQINACLEQRMGQKPLAWEGDDLLLLTVYVKALANGLPLHVQADGPLAPFVAAGERAYRERVGQFDVACRHCHESVAGSNLRAETMSTPSNRGLGEKEALVRAVLAADAKGERGKAASLAGATIGSGSAEHWPAFRLKWGKLASLQHRLRTCNQNVRVEPLPYGDDLYVNLELYLATLSNGLPVNVPGFRP